MKKLCSVLLVLALMLSCGAALSVSADAKVLVPVKDTGGNPITNNSVVNGGNGTLTETIFFKNVSGGEITVVGVDIDTKGGDLSQFPFDPVNSTYYSALSETLQADAVTTAGYPFSMRCRGDAAPGYYAVDFIVTYERKTTDPNNPIERVTTTVPWDVLVKEAAGASESTVGTVPKVLITGFTTSPAQVVAGEDFTLSVTFKNTSGSNSIDNLKAVLTSDGTFNAVSGSSTMFVQHLDPGASSTQSIRLHAKADASPGSYSVSFAMSFDAPGVKDPISDAEAVAIPVAQVPKIQITSIQTMGNMMVGNDLNVMTTVNNTGKSTLYNVMATVSDTAGLMSSEEMYLGNIQSGASGNVDVYLSAMTAGDTEVTVHVTYEDENGKQFYQDVTTPVTLNEMMDSDDPWEPSEPVEPQGGGIPWWIFLVAALVVGGVVALILVKNGKRKKQRQRDLAAARALDAQYLNDTDDAFDTEDTTL